METTLTPETDAEARLMTLGSDDSCIDVYIERDNRNVEGDFVLADFARKLERECNEARQAITDLTQRLQERQKSFQAQLIRIEDTWREKLSAVTKDANRLANALDPIAWLHSMPEDGKAFNEAEEAMMAHETLASNH